MGSVINFREDFDRVILERHGGALFAAEKLRQIMEIFGPQFKRRLKPLFQESQIALTPTRKNHAVEVSREREFAGDPIGVHQSRHADAQHADFVF